MKATIVIKRDVDRNYDRLFKRVEATVLFRRDAVSLSERETAGGYAVEFAELAPEVLEYCESHPNDYEVR